MVGFILLHACTYTPHTAHQPKIGRLTHALTHLELQVFAHEARAPKERRGDAADTRPPARPKLVGPLLVRAGGKGRQRPALLLLLLQQLLLGRGGGERPSAPPAEQEGRGGGRCHGGWSSWGVATMLITHTTRAQPALLRAAGWGCGGVRCLPACLPRSSPRLLFATDRRRRQPTCLLGVGVVVVDESVRWLEDAWTSIRHQAIDTGSNTDK